METDDELDMGESAGCVGRGERHWELTARLILDLAATPAV